MSDQPELPDDGSMRPAEQALRLLTGAEAQHASVTEVSDPVFAAEVARWRGRTAPLFNEIDSVVPPASLWLQIENSIGPAAANDNMLLNRRLRTWRWATAGMSGLAACLAILLVVEPPRPVKPPTQVEVPAKPPMVAMLSGDNGMKVVASWHPGDRQLVLAVAGAMRADAKHAHELWVIPADGKPRSLGTMATGKQMHMRLEDTLARLLEQGATIAISVEPPGGSPTGLPTGPVVASGPLANA